MDNTTFLLGAVALLWIVFIALRAPATILFFALLVGQLISQQLASEVFDLTNQYLSVSDVRYVHIGLLVLPIIISLLILRGRVNKSKRLIEAPALLLLAVSVMILADNYLSLSQNLPSDQAALLATYEGIIVSAGAALSLVSSWLNYPKPHKDHKKK